MGKYSLIPGMESFMEDTSVEVDVEVGDGAEVVEEQAEAVDEEATVVEETTEAEEESEQAEMIFAQYDRIATYLDHARKYGVDRTFLSLLNSDGSLSQAIGYSLPACESFDVTGSPMSAESQAVIAGLENVFESIWNFIKKIARKIRDFFSNIWNAIIARFGDIDKQIGRLKVAMTKRTWDASKAADFRSEIFDLDALKKVQAKLTEFFKNPYVDECRDYMASVEEFSRINSKTSVEKYSDSYGNDKAKDVIKKAKDLIKDAKKELKTSSATNVTQNLCEQMLAKAGEMRVHVVKSEAKKRIFETAAKQLENVARTAEKHTGEPRSTDGRAAKIRKAASYINEAFGTFSMSVGVIQKAARMLVTSAAKIINGCMRREGEERE